MEIAVRLLLGAALGAAGGLLLARSRLCSGGKCAASRPRLWFSILAGAVFGAGVAWALSGS